MFKKQAKKRYARFFKTDLYLLLHIDLNMNAMDSCVSAYNIGCVLAPHLNNITSA